MDRKSTEHGENNVKRLSNVWRASRVVSEARSREGRGEPVVKLKQMAIFIAHKTQHNAASATAVLNA
jgi:hypothetical protein